MQKALLVKICHSWKLSYDTFGSIEGAQDEFTYMMSLNIWTFHLQTVDAYELCEMCIYWLLQLLDYTIVAMLGAAMAIFEDVHKNFAWEVYIWGLEYSSMSIGYFQNLDYIFLCCKEF